MELDDQALPPTRRQLDIWLAQQSVAPVPSGNSASSRESSKAPYNVMPLSGRSAERCKVRLPPCRRDRIR
jgi:hypothetical protein